MIIHNRIHTASKLNDYFHSTSGFEPEIMVHQYPVYHYESCASIRSESLYYAEYIVHPELAYSDIIRCGMTHRHHKYRLC